MNETPETRQHCVDGPSHLNALAVCIAHDNREGDTRDSIEGTAAHALLAWNIDPENNPDPAEDANLAAGLTHIIVGTVHWAVDMVHTLAAGQDIMSERRVFNPKNDRFGTADLSWRDYDGTRNVADFKSKSEQSADKSYQPQIMEYALMSAAMESEDGEVNRDEVCIGHVLHGGSRTVETFRFTLGEAEDTVNALLEARYAFKIFKSGCRHTSPWCKTCANAMSCPAVTLEAEAVAAPSNAITVAKSSGVAVTEEELVKALAIKSSVEAWVKAVSEAAKAWEGDVLEADGIRYERTERNGQAPLKDVNGLWAAADQHGVTSEAFTALCKISRSAVVDAIRQAGPTKEWRGKTIPAMTEKEAAEIARPFHGEASKTKIGRKVK